jgi:hypothetical protein
MIGTYKEFIVYNEISMQYVTQKRWSCCLNTSLNAPGCNIRPHICKELMLSIRAESDPVTTIDDMEFTILNAVEISVFPGAIYELQLKLSTELINVIHQFLSLEDEVDEANITNEDGNMRISEGKLSGNDKAITASQNRNTNGSNATTSKSKGQPVKKDNTNNLDVSTSNKLARHNSIDTSTKDSNADVANGNVAITSQKQEILYIKYLRVGDISVSLTTDLLPIKIENGKVFVEQFVMHGKVLDWSRLLKKFERHAQWSVSRNFASSSMNSLFKNKFFQSNNSINSNNNINKSNIHEEDDDFDRNEYKKRIMLLGR